MGREFLSRTATAPISWGVCELPGWGIQLPVERVLSEMAALGFPATELGSAGYLPTDPSQLRSVLDTHGLSLLAGFVPVVIHDPAQADESLRRAEQTASQLADAGAMYFNTAPVTSWDWEARRTLTDDEWAHAMGMFVRLEELAATHGLTQVLHPHVGTIVETSDDVMRVLDQSDVRFVLDTAHLALGGYDPVAFVSEMQNRVGLVHLKDADMSVAERLNNGELTLMQAVQQGIFPPIGGGDLRIDTVVTTLERAGYSGWYVLEQDVAITGDEPPQGEGPIAGIRQSLDYLGALQEQIST